MPGRNTHRLSTESTREHRGDDKDKERDPPSSNMLRESTIRSSDYDIILDHDSEALSASVVRNKSQEDLNPGESGDDEDGENLENAEDECAKLKLLQSDGVGRPLVWVRIKPTPSVNHKLLEVEDNDTKLRISVENSEKKESLSAFTFVTDGILQTSNQEEVFQKTVKELVEKAMDGVTGAVICVGPELSGKNYTLFGPLKYQHRGLVPRSLELIFDIVEQKRDELEYHVILSMFEIHMERIKDLFTLGPYDLGRIGDFGPKGLFYEEIMSLEHGLSLILRGLTGQGLIHSEPYARFHTIVYVDILAKQKQPGGGDSVGNKATVKEWRSRITFAKIASMPPREKVIPNPISPNIAKIQQLPLFDPPPPLVLTCSPPPPSQCVEQPSKQLDETEQSPRSIFASIRSDKEKCCRGPTGEQAEAICVRKEYYFLEQMFIRSHELRQIHDYYNKLQSLGMYMLMCPPKLAPSQYFRQSKLTHCLKDIVSGSTMVRLILHIRPERSFLQSTLETMRFATRARCIPIDLGRKKGCRDNCHALMEKINNMCQEMGIQNPGQNMVKDDRTGEVNNHPDFSDVLFVKIGRNKLRDILQQATAFFGEKLDSLEGACKDQVKSLFETFRETLNHMFDKDREIQEGTDLSHPDELDHDHDQDHDLDHDRDEHDHDDSEANQQRHSSSSHRKGRGKDQDGKLNSAKQSNKLNKKKGNKQTGSGSNNKRQPNSQNDQDHDKTGAGEGESGPESDTTHSATDKKGTEVGNKSGFGSTAAGPIPGEDVDELGGPDAPTIGAEHGVDISSVDITIKEREKAQSTDASGTRESQEQLITESRQFQEQCWNDFLKSEHGSQLLDQFKEKQETLRKVLRDHNEAQKELASGMEKLTELQLQLDILEQDNKFNGVFSDEQGNPIVASPEEQQVQLDIQSIIQAEQELMTKLKEIRSSTQENKCRLDSSKRDVEHAFLTFCMESHGKHAELTNLPLSTLDHAVSTTLKRWSRVHRVKSPPPPEILEPLESADSMLGASEKDIMMAREFEYLKRIAQQQVETLMQAYPKRPPWNSYY